LMSPACPINNKTVDERGARLCALLVLLPLGLSLCLASPWPALFLAADFGMRGLGVRRWSPVARVAQALVAVLRLAPRPIDAGPKAFAAKLGLAFSLALVLAFSLGRESLGLVVGVPFALCALLEGLFGLCVGCRVHQLLQRLRPHPSLLDTRATPDSRS
jgi:hypothetical protein